MYFALLDDNYATGGVSYLYENPVGFVRCDSVAMVSSCIDKLEQARESGLHVVGAASYELAEHYGFHTMDVAGGDVPLLHFGLFRSREKLSSAGVDQFLTHRRTGHEPFVCNIRPAVEEQAYLEAIARIREHLVAGNSYQVNYTFEVALEVGGCEFSFYQALRNAQPVEFGAFLNFPDQKILSRSPELFFRKKGDRLATRPMKGTEPRSPDDPVADEALKARLRTDEKQQSENVMIVDLMRNDLGQIARTGSVQVDDLFTVETYKSVHQMTSGISCWVSPEIRFGQILDALFPCGSITGAPKKRTTEIITEIEANPRGVYTGAIGYLTPENDMCFNVPIRTLSLGQQRNAKFNIGGGVVYDSVARKEYDEALLKGRFLLGHKPGFHALDCFFHSPRTGSRHRALHVARLVEACRALGFPVTEVEIDDALDRFLPGVKESSKIRVEVDSAGKIAVGAADLGPETTVVKQVRLSPDSIDSRDPVFRYKTTNRHLFSREFARCRRDFSAYDVLFQNERGELTEASNHNLFLRFGDRFITPPLRCGLLNGVGRAVFLEQNRDKVSEEVMGIDMLERADQVLLVSSIRGVCEVEYVPDNS